MTNLDLLTLMLRTKLLTFTLTGDLTSAEEFVVLNLEEFNRIPHSEGNRVARQVLELANYLREGLIDEAEAKTQLRGVFGIPSTRSYGKTSELEVPRYLHLRPTGRA